MRIILASNDTKTLKAKAERLKELQEERAKINKEYEALKKELMTSYISSIMENHKDEKKFEFEIDSNELFVFELVPTTRFNSSLFAKEHPLLKKKYTKTGENKVFKVITIENE